MWKATVILLLVIAAYFAYEMGYLPVNLGSLFSSPAKHTVKPYSDGSCPDSHPVKGSFATSSGGLCIYHLRGQRNYDKTRAERCYATEEEAKGDGCSKALDPDW